MNITYVTGDLLESDERYIAHGCNCEGKFGAGIALHIANKYPEVAEAYFQHVSERKFVPGTVQPVRTLVGSRTVFNMGTQYAPGRDGNYWFVALSFGNLFEHCIRNNIHRVGIPRIGCGIAGLEWPAVEYVINGVGGQRPIGPDIVVYTRPEEVHLFEVIDVDSWEV